MGSFVEVPQWRLMVVTRFEPRLTHVGADGRREAHVGADGRREALRLSEADLWKLGREIAASFHSLLSVPTLRYERRPT
ncbi:hypothetical protein ACRAWG_00595 [Methylobacterium sp. P31]